MFLNSIRSLVSIHTKKKKKKMTPSASGRLGLLLGDRSVVFLFEMCGKNFSVFTPSCLDHPVGVFFLQSHIIPRELLGKYSQYLTEIVQTHVVLLQ